MSRLGAMTEPATPTGTGRVDSTSRTRGDDTRN